MPTASHPSTHQNPECTSGASSPALRQAIFSPDSTRRLVVGYVSFDSRLVVGWWSVTCRLVVDWWSVMCQFLQATFGLNPCQSSSPSQNPPRNSITTTQNPPKPTTIPSLSSMGIIPAEPPPSARATTWKKRSSLQGPGNSDGAQLVNPTPVHINTPSLSPSPAVPRSAPSAPIPAAAPSVSPTARSQTPDSASSSPPTAAVPSPPTPHSHTPPNPPAKTPPTSTDSPTRDHASQSVKSQLCRNNNQNVFEHRKTDPHSNVTSSSKKRRPRFTQCDVFGLRPAGGLLLWWHVAAA